MAKRVGVEYNGGDRVRSGYASTPIAPLSMTTERQTETLLRFCASATAKDIQAALVHARTGWLKDWLAEHLPEIVEGGDSPEDVARYLDWDLRAKQMMAARGLERPEQQKNRVTDIRNAIKSVDPDHPALPYVGFSKEEWEKINRAGDDAVAERPALFIENPIAIVERAEELLNSRDWYDLAAGLAVLTGRRCAEVMKTAVFEYKTPYSVTFTGAVKRRGEPISLVFEIPTLTRAERIVAAIAKLRAWVDTTDMDNRAINNHYSGAVIKSCDRHFTGLVPNREGRDNLYTHLFRAVYATIASHWFCPPRVPEGEFKAYIQGHFQILDTDDPTLRHNFSSGRHYSDYAIGDGNGNRDGRLGIRLGEPDVSVVEAFRSFYRPDSTVHGGAKDTVEGTVREGTPESSEKEAVRSIDPGRPDKPGTKKSSNTRTVGSLNTRTTGATNDRQLPLPLPDVTTVPAPDLREILGWMLNSRQYTVLLVGLMTVTGQSPGELIKSGFFKLTPDRSALTFSPTSVTRSSSLLPTLLSPDLTFAAIERLREHPKVKNLRYLSPNEIDSRCLQRLGRALHLYLPFPDVGELFEFYRSEAAKLPFGTVATATPPGEDTLADDGTSPTTDSSIGGTATGANVTEPSPLEVAGDGIEMTTTEPDTTGTGDSTALRWAGIARSIASSLGIDDPDSFRAWVEKQLRPETSASTVTERGAIASEPDSTPNVESSTIPDEPDSPSALENVPPTSDPPEPVTGETERGIEEPMTLERMFLAQQRSLDQLTGAIFKLVDSLASSRTGRGGTRATPRERAPSDHSLTTDATGAGSTASGDTTETRSSPKTPDSPSGAGDTVRRATSPGRAGNEALVHRAIDAVLYYNDSIAATKKDRWLVSWSALKQLTKCNQEVIARVLDSRKDEIDRHHEKHELGTFHNSKGKFAPKISEVIRLE